ncbi:MAG TPA: PKD domain-containing protein [Candidatus Methylomirabilis sp.]|nr:PKD domain-containing protein [Candidatus Methylomirabilis sp.]
MNNRIVNRGNFTRMWILGMALLLAACGNGHGNSAPVANAGPDQTSNVQVGDAVLLDGSTSSDPDGDPLTYSWSFETVPANSTAAFPDPTAAKPSFIPDQPGMYTARLRVNDGLVDSAPDTVSVTVVAPPPKVAITAPENLSVVTTPSMTVTGTVDDPNATLTVDGEPVANNNGNYTTVVALAEGSNTVMVIGQNSTGAGSASVEVILDTTNNPALSIISPKPTQWGVIAGGEFAMGVPFPISTPVTVTGVIKVNTKALLPADNRPTVTVNGVPADVSLDLFFSTCGLLNPFQCWKFTTTIPLAQGNDTITAVGTDVQNRSTTMSIGGVVDYCRKATTFDANNSTPGNFDPGVLALAGENHEVQSNRCHEIDGCSAPVIPNAIANDPMSVFIPELNVAPTDFGKGTQPPGEYFIHGLQSTYDLPCNHHDVCYQTCWPAGTDLESKWHDCNYNQFQEMLAVCRQAYPATCPSMIPGYPLTCVTWLLRKAECTDTAGAYWASVETKKGWERFQQRQLDYCAQ